MDAEIPSLDAGTIVFSMGVEEAWPVQSGKIVFDSQLSDGRLFIIAQTSGHLEVVLYQPDGDDFIEVSSRRSCHIQSIEANAWIFAVAWCGGEIDALRLNGLDLLSEPDDSIIVPGSKGAAEPRDFTSMNEAARLNRYHSLMGIHNRRMTLDEEQAYMNAALEAEADQITDLLDLVRGGREAHISGLASRVRLLTIGKPFGLLQHCAAYQQLPLIVYSNESAEESPKIDAAFTIHGSWFAMVAPIATLPGRCPEV